MPRPDERDQRVARVRPDLTAVAREFDYEVPDALAGAIRVGTVVRVPLHGRRVRGWVVGDDVAPDPEAGRLLPIAKVVGAGPPAALLDLARWTAHRWVGSDVALFRAATAPNAVREPWPDVASRSGPGFAVDVLAWPPAADRRELVAARVADDGSTLVLVPDGARLGALVRDLERRGRRVLVLRADLDDATRTRAWSAARRGDVVVVGGRTAVWVPLPDLAAVVVLDEGDEALQEERVPTWHARDVVLERAHRAGARVTLVGPVPTPEAQARAAGTVERPARAAERAGWPAVEVVDLRVEPPGNGLLSDALARSLHRAIDAGDRAVCVLNRKGRAKLLTCLACSMVAACERCEAAVVEVEPGSLTCPRCGTTRPVICLACHHTKLRASRLGIQKLRDALAALLPRTGIAWLDASVDEVPDAPVVVGTEAVLHRIDARLVAFLDLDQELFAHRVRATQQAATLVGRAARVVGARSRGGRLLLQTHHPDHVVVEWARSADPAPVMALESARRSLLAFPPAGAVAELSGDADAVRAAIDVLRSGVRVVGPSERGAGLAALVHAADPETLADALAPAAAVGRAAGRLRIAVDPPRV
ncbi:MAG: primosomal protein N' family DNA-binding protein [Acidimicrobiia bacterium]